MGRTAFIFSMSTIEMESLNAAIAAAAAAAATTPLNGLSSLSDGLMPIRQEPLIPSTIYNSLTEEQKQALIKAGVLPAEETTK